MYTCDSSKGAICHVAGCSLQVVFVNQLKLVLVTVLHVPRSACMHTDRGEKSVNAVFLKVTVVLTKKILVTITQCSFKVGGDTEKKK